MRTADGLFRAMHSFSRAAVDGRVGSTAASFLLRPILRRLAPASLDQLAALSVSGIHLEPYALAHQLWRLTDVELAQTEGEFANVWLTVEQRLKEGGGRYPAVFRADRTVAFLVYVACRRERPTVVLETGVADGITSLTILTALEANGRGTLHSIDVRGDVGQLLSVRERSRWTLHVLQGDRRGALRRALSRVPRGQLFFHDSNHSYHWQMSELKAASAWLLPGGLVLADDVDASRAYGDWCHEQMLAPHLCFARTRIFGAVRVSRDHPRGFLTGRD